MSNPLNVVVLVNLVSAFTYQACLLTKDNLKETGSSFAEALGNLVLVHGKAMGIQIIQDVDVPTEPGTRRLLVENYCEGIWQATTMKGEMAYGKSKGEAIGKILDVYGDKFPWIEIKR